MILTSVLESRFSVIRAVYLLNILLSLLYVFTVGIDLNSVLIVLGIFFFMNPLGIAVSYHRYWSHGSFEFRNVFMMLLCTIPPMISCIGSILGWVGMHRQHHRYSDTDLDPHKASKGFFSMLYMETYDYKPNPRYVVDLMRNKFITYSHKYYFAFPLAYVMLLGILFGIHGIVIGFCMPAALSLITQNTTNYINHLGDNEFTPSNATWINMFNFGDGWHKNHHDNPRSYTTQKEWWQIDPAGWMIKYVFAEKKSLSNS